MSLEELKSEGHLRGPLVDLDDFCIEWYRTLTSTGYPIDYNPKTKKVELLCRILLDAPPNLTVDHLCQNRACIRIDHLELVSRGENNRRCKVFHRSTTCIVCGSRDFKYYPTGGRHCRPCGRRQCSEHWKAKSSDPLWREASNKKQNLRYLSPDHYYHRNRDRINAARREKRRQAKSA